MSKRSAKYKVSTAVEDLVPKSSVEEMVKRIVNKAYEHNLTIGTKIYTHRFRMFLCQRKLVSGEELLEALRKHPTAITELLIIVGLTEEKGEDMAYVVLQDEVASTEAYKKFANIPCVPPLEYMIQVANKLSVEDLPSW